MADKSLNSMKVSIDFARSYFSLLTTVIIEQNEDPLTRMESFDSSISSIETKLKQDSDDEKWLRLSMKSLITDPESEIMTFRGVTYSFTQSELVRVFTYAYKKLWQDPEFDEVAKIKVTFETMTDLEWKKEKEMRELLYGY